LIAGALGSGRQVRGPIHFPRCLHPGNSEGMTMTDLIFIAITIGFFVAAIAYTHGCEKLRGGSHE